MIRYYAASFLHHKKIVAQRFQALCRFCMLNVVRTLHIPILVQFNQPYLRACPSFALDAPEKTP